MAKRKKVEIIEIDGDFAAEEVDKPVCFGQKTCYCRSDLCGIDWYNRCQGVENDQGINHD